MIDQQKTYRACPVAADLKIEAHLLRIVIDCRTKCWRWQGPRGRPTSAGSHGYGFLMTPDGQNRNAHRWFYETFVGPIPEGLELDHLCRNTLCVNPSHLEPVTHQINMQRGVRAAGNHCPKGHLRVAMYGRRSWCQICCRERARLRRAADPEKHNTYQRAWHAANREKRNAAVRAARAAWSEERKAAFRAADRERARAYRAANLEKCRAWDRARNARDRSRERARRLK